MMRLEVSRLPGQNVLTTPKPLLPSAVYKKNLTHLLPGTYLVKVVGEDFTASRRIGILRD